MHNRSIFQRSPVDHRSPWWVIYRYKPQSHQLDSKLKPFIPDYIPAVGDIDEFLKVGRPDGKPEELGLHVMDEPSSKQSDPTVLNLQLRQVRRRPGERCGVEECGRVVETVKGRVER
jgi:intraflagellar transport protein 46